MDEAYYVVEFLLEDLELVLSNTSNSTLSEESPAHVISLYENLKIIQSCLKRLKEAPINRKKLLSFFLKKMRDRAVEILDATDSCLINGLTKSNGNFGATEVCSLFNHSPNVAFRAKQIGLFKTAFSCILATKKVRGLSRGVSSRMRNSSPVLGQEKVVGFDDEATVLLDKLTGKQKQLEVLSLVGMAGIGKTTLAKRLYNDPRVVYHFHVRGWTCGPQLVEETNALHDILSCIAYDKGSLYKMSEEQMGEKLYKLLKGKRYLIVIDGIWDSFSWNHSMKQYFPNDGNGSKVLITSRIKDVALEISTYSSPQVLPFLSQNECWALFESRVFTDESCPQELMGLGKEMVEKCKGLPLAIVVLAGVAKKDKSPEWWTHILKDIRSCIRGEDQFLDILALSYDHLPNWLKPCFLYLGSFPRGYEIPVKKLVWSWIAEGFVEHNGEKKLEDIGEEYLTDLVDRSLLIASKWRSNGRIKTCRVHDLLRDLCARKAQDELLLQPICRCRQISLFSATRSTLYNCFYKGMREPGKMLHYLGPTLPTIQCFHSYNFHFVSPNDVKSPHISMVHKQIKWLVYKLVRVLDLGYIIQEHFPVEILQLVHLKYLFLRIYSLRKLPLLSTLWNLETFILVTEKEQSVTLPKDIWELVKLRHLHVSGELTFENASWSSSTPSVLYNLQTISQLCPSDSIQDVLVRIPNLVSLGLHLTLSDPSKHSEFPDLCSLKLLETLTFDYQTFGMVQFCISNPRKFPPNLKKLTLIGSHVVWKDLSIFGMLPNLEILKIKDNFCNDPMWETSDEGFCHLKFLKLSHTGLQQWIATSSSFPCLEKLVINGCLDLEEIPSSFGDIDTLEMIEVYHSSESAADSARQIQESQKCMGNDLKVLLQPPLSRGIEELLVPFIRVCCRFS